MTVLGVISITTVLYLIITVTWVFYLEDYFEKQDEQKFGVEADLNIPNSQSQQISKEV
ncbi:MAG: hypothetical protein SCK28_00850 [Bacillota bacterium]|nr:hypothetical protein [Bacillota bacterium]